MCKKYIWLFWVQKSCFSWVWLSLLIPYIPPFFVLIIYVGFFLKTKELAVPVHIIYFSTLCIFFRFLSHVMNAVTFSLVVSRFFFFRELKIFTRLCSILVTLGLLCPCIEVFNLSFYLWICVKLYLSQIFIILLLPKALASLKHCVQYQLSLYSFIWEWWFCCSSI